MERPVIIFIAVVTVISLIIAILLFVLFIQRRRQRALLMLAIAQEEADRRRRKRRRAGLRRWEIDLACPEALVAHISPSTSPVELFTVDRHRAQYAAAIRSLRAAGVVSADVALPDRGARELTDAPALSADELDLPAVPPPLMLEDKTDGQYASVPTVVKSDAASEQDDDIPLQILHLPEGQETCVICLDDITVGSRVRSLPCNHVYHSQCIRVWLRRKNACPCCCVKVIKRRKKRSRRVDITTEDLANALDDPDLALIRDEPSEHYSPPRSSSPRSPSPAPSPRTSGLLYGDDLLPVVHERPADRRAETVSNVMELRSKSLSYCGDRPRPSATSQRQPSFIRNGSFVDPDDPSSEIFASEASFHEDEPSGSELLYQVRRALRGESSMISLNTSVDDVSEVGLNDNGMLSDTNGDADEDSFREDLETSQYIDLESGKRRGTFAGESNHL